MCYNNFNGGYMGIKEYILIGSIILLIVFIVALIVVLKKRPNLKKIIKNKQELGDLIEITYSNGGGRNGDSDFISLDTKKKKMTVESRTSHLDPLKVKEYKIDNIDKLIEMIEKYNMPAWSTLPIDTSNLVLDAPIKTIIFSYKKDNKVDYYNIDFNMMIEPFGRDILNEFLKELFLLKNKDNLVKEYTKRD